ncbi:PREDICTED: uncharacterized protein LOC104608613 [Nelumbo nucifera]|uniref:Uncharacterized protein LOC104608613 n=1 Tax=Nelumbo nucifera TaxID=4432 RepID=A0A1U8QAT5_NELNU|nr:PREDICTED: uncharacterized protein LOC104608613 [Nelumbo nucifera]
MTSQGAVVAPPSTGTECCMCGDYGLSAELFRCRDCQFRFQHRYCSNLYPKAESYRVCNWCLKKGVNTQNLPLPSSSNCSENDDKNARNNIGDEAMAPKVQRGSLQLHLSSPMKKLKSPDKSSSARKKIIPRGILEERYQRMKQEEIPNTGATRQIFRGKIRRYKLLDEFSS